MPQAPFSEWMVNSSQKPWIESLPEGHIVQLWWEGELADLPGASWPEKPDAVRLDAKRNSVQAGVERTLLVRTIEEQYAASGMPSPPRCSDLKNPESYTVTTGHQLCLAGGPAYTYYKIRTAVELARRCEIRWCVPVVPIFWLASEDHDFDEIRRVWDGKAWLNWVPESPKGGAVGRMDTTGLASFLDAWYTAVGMAPGTVSQSKNPGPTLSDAMRHWVHDHFGSDGILVVDGDDPTFKTAFVSVMREEVSTAFTREKVEQCNVALRQAGAEPQVFVRDCNLFHLSEGSRTRLVCQNGQWQSLAGKSWPDLSALLEDISMNPGDFSPNALLRPLYQSCVLPDVAVVGGPAEIGYWLQLPGVFAHVNRTQPVLVPRDSFLVLPRKWALQMQRNGLSSEDLTNGLTEWEQGFVDEQSAPDLNSWRLALKREAEEALDEFSAFDPSLEGSVKAARAKMEGLLERLESQVRRAVKRKEKDALDRLAKLHAWVQPDGHMQERVAHFDHLQSVWDQTKGDTSSLTEAIDEAMTQGHKGENWSPLMHILLQTPS